MFHNSAFNTSTTISTVNFDNNTSNLFVKSVKVDGQAWESNCWIDFDVFENGGTVELELTADDSVGCAGSLPASLSTGGFN